MSDRGQLELAQITDRLLKSRIRPKRQYLIQRIGHIWTKVPQGHHCCFVGRMKTHHHHTEPTRESIAAVSSFERDEQLDVRIAVTFALRQKSVSDTDSAPTLSRMLGDSHPFIRVNAARALSHAARQSLEPEVLSAALVDQTWTVRCTMAPKNWTRK